MSIKKKNSYQSIEKKMTNESTNLRKVKKSRYQNQTWTFLISILTSIWEYLMTYHHHRRTRKFKRGNRWKFIKFHWLKYISNNHNFPIQIDWYKTIIICGCPPEDAEMSTHLFARKLRDSNSGSQVRRTRLQLFPVPFSWHF